MAVQTEKRATDYAGTLDGKKTAILEAARETRGEATEMMQAYLGDDALQEIVDWALPTQEKHLETVRASSLDLAKEEDALAPA
ncbi:MAG: hypothetical protein HYX29_11480 [Solirubrobacterales bacterium]|nr:hypothetical protein [Solirubrobacterales bacterium]